MKRFSDFQNLDSQELAANESFQVYVLRRDKNEIIFWETFISMYPEKQADIKQAVEILSLLSFRKKNTTPQFKESELNRLLFTIGHTAPDIDPAVLEKSEPFLKRHRSFVNLFNDYSWSRIAASFAGLLILFTASFYIYLSGQDSEIKYQTAYGQNATFVLPDSSIVTLNGNTRLIHHENWDQDNMREVWLDGEAFFEVKNDSKTRFVVHTRGMDVEVLGTRFNVFNRDDRANVVLNSGKVKVKISSESDTSSVLMMPDEAVEFYRKDNTITKRQVKAEVLTSWRNKLLVFENTPLYKIKEMIEYTYGVDVIFSQNVDASEELAGTIPTDNLEVLLTVLAKSSNLHITRNNDEIIIDKKDPVSNNPKPK
jgi:transmembrane sensor